MFQTSSELILHTGPEGSHWHTVAEFCNDGSGELANRLLRAINVVRRESAKEQAEREKEAVESGPL